MPDAPGAGGNRLASAAAADILEGGGPVRSCLKRRAVKVGIRSGRCSRPVDPFTGRLLGCVAAIKLFDSHDLPT
jgi:hypothetical protein